MFLKRRDGRYTRQCRSCYRGNREGYVLIKVGGRWVREHRHIMETAIGRKLRKGETVHHKNGIRDDNDLKNLELWAKPQPAGIRAIDMLRWAREVVALYEPIEHLLGDDDAIDKAS